MRRAVVGVVGHVDHGKTALVRALTGQDTDRLPEEKARGISIALGFAHCEVEGAAIDLIDAPGHERFVRTMIAGAGGFDALLLVVAANEGIRPQTIEHVAIAGLLGIGRAVVAVTKADLVSVDEAMLVAEEAGALLAEAGLSIESEVVTSAATGRGIEALRSALAGLATETGETSGGAIVWLPIDRAFAIAGHGPVVTGTLRGDAVAPGDSLALWPCERPVKVRGVQVHGRTVERADPRQRVAVNLRDVAIGDLHHGMALATPGALAPSEWLTIALRTLAEAPPLRNGLRVQVLVGTAEVEARLRLLEGDVAEPGTATFAQLRLAEPLAMPARVPLILRLPAPVGTVGGGVILDPQATRLRRGVAGVLARLGRLRDADVAEIVTVEAMEPVGTTVTALLRLTALRREPIEAILGTLPVIVQGEAVLPREAVDRLKQRLRRRLGPAGVALDASSPLLDEATRQLRAEGVAIQRGSRLLPAHPASERTRARNEAALAERLAETLCVAGLTPPLPTEMIPDPVAERAIERLIRAGTIVRAIDRAKGKALLFHRDAIAEARSRLAPLLAPEPGLLVTEIAAALGLSRKYVMPLLDHLDTTCFTRRDGDRRRLHEAFKPLPGREG